MRQVPRTSPLLALLATMALLAACAPSTGGAEGDEAAAGDGTAAAGDPATGATEPGAASTEAAGGDGGGEGEAVTLTVWSWRTEDVEEYERIFDVYEEANPNVTVEFRPYVNTEYNTILATGLTEQGGPDVAQLRAYGGLQPLVEAGNLVPIGDEIAALDEFSEDALAGARGLEDGQIYGVPFAVQTLQMFYNRALFEEQGLEEPQTWDEFMTILQTFEDAGVTPMATTGSDVWMLPIVHETLAATRYGGPQFQEALQSGEATFTDDDYVASIDVVNQVQEYFPDDVVGIAYTDAQTLFISGQAAMFPGGSFELGFFRSQAPDFELGVFSVPPPPDAVVDHILVPSWTDGSWGINANSPNQDEALELLEWMASEEFGQLFVDELGQISPIPGTESSDEVLAEIVQAWQENPSPYLLLVDFRFGEPSGTDLMGEGIQAMLLGESSPQQVAQQLWEGVTQWFEPEGG